MSHIHIHGTVTNLSIGTGDNSISQSGNNNTAQQCSPQGAQWEQVLAGLKQLQALAQALPQEVQSREEIRQAVEQAVKSAQSADKKPQEKAGLLKRAIEGVKDMADLVSGGETLATRCTQLLGFLAPFLPALGI